jgi:hypothetical protein
LPRSDRNHRAKRFRTNRSTAADDAHWLKRSRVGTLFCPCPSPEKRRPQRDELDFRARAPTRPVSARSGGRFAADGLTTSPVAESAAAEMPQGNRPSLI